MKELRPLTQWAIHKIETEYKDDIALLLSIEGHSTGEDGHGECFDYFIPETERGIRLSETFIIDGIGYDLYPRSWERMEKSVTLDEMTIVLANATILYARTEGDRQRFLAMQQKLSDNLKDPVFVYQKALKRLDSSMDLYRTLIFEKNISRARSEAAFIHLYLSQAVAFLNHTFTESPLFSERQAGNQNPKGRMYHCPDLKQVPESFFSCANRLLTANDVPALRDILYQLISATRDFIFSQKPERKLAGQDPVDYSELADWYQELSLSWRRIRYFCQQGMAEEAYVDACNLQDELLIIAQEFQIEEMELLDSFSPASLRELDLRARELEKRIRQILAEHHIPVKEYDSMDSFLSARMGGNAS